MTRPQRPRDSTSRSKFPRHRSTAKNGEPNPHSIHKQITNGRNPTSLQALAIVRFQQLAKRGAEFATDFSSKPLATLTKLHQKTSALVSLSSPPTITLPRAENPYTKHNAGARQKTRSKMPPAKAVVGVLRTTAAASITTKSRRT